MKAAIKTISAIALSLSVALPAQADGLLQVKQTIFGMDCAPCAYGVQQRLKKLPGITQVDVSLNDGIALIQIAPDSTVSLAQIHDVLVDGGFTPKQAVVTVVGHLAKQGSNWILVSGPNKYALVFPQETGSALQPDAEVKVQGELAEPASSPVPELKVQSAEPVAPGH